MNEFNVSRKQLRQYVDEIKENKIRVSHTLKPHSFHKKLWFEHSSRRYIYQLHSLAMIDYLLQYYKMTSDSKTIEKALSLFYSWYEENYPNSQSDLCYKGHVIARRLLVVSELLEISYKENICILDDVFIEVIASHTEYLTHDYLYKKEHLDGINQDIALLLASRVYNRVYIKDAYLPYVLLAKKRLSEQLDYFISDDYIVFLETSIQNAYLLFLRLIHLQAFLKDEQEDEKFIQYIKLKLDLLYVRLYDFTEVGGALVPIGDSSVVVIDKNLFLTYDHPYHSKYKALFIKDKKVPKEIKHYNKEHLFVVTQNDYKFIFMNGLTNKEHRHHDHLSFLLSYKGIPLLIDGGKYNYQEDNYYRQTLVSCHGHNTICVDGLDYPIEKETMNKSAITNIINHDELLYCCGIHLFYHDVMIKRSIFILNKMFFIIDEFFAKEAHEYEIIFHINPELNLKTDKNILYYALFHQEKIFQMRNVFSTMELTKEYDFGNEENFRGFRSRKLDHIEPSHLLKYKGSGQDECVITMINLGEDRPIDIKVSDKIIKINNKYKIHRGQYTNYINHIKNEINYSLSIQQDIKQYFGNNQFT